MSKYLLQLAADAEVYNDFAASAGARSVNSTFLDTRTCNDFAKRLSQYYIVNRGELW